MKNYYVEIQFTRGPTFSITKVPAVCNDYAKTRVMQEARSSGFYEKVKKVIVKELVNQI